MCKALFGVLAIVIAYRASASLWNYDSASEDIKEYIVDSITNCVGNADILLVYTRDDEPWRDSDFTIPYGLAVGLGLKNFRCVERLKGGNGIYNLEIVYLYDTPRIARISGGRYFPEFPDLGISLGGPDCSGGGEFYECNGKRHYIKGKEVWRFRPPYDPSPRDTFSDYVELRYVLPVRELKKTRILSRYYQMDVDKSLLDYNSIPADTLMVKLGVAETFSNHVYQIEEGCSFQVDYPEPDNEWKGVVVTNERHKEIVRSHREKNSDIMHLSSEEVSEIVYLSYLADKRYSAADYDAACRRCPKILKPVKEFKTEIGKRLKAAMESGGMLPIRAFGVFAAPSDTKASQHEKR